MTRTYVSRAQQIPVHVVAEEVQVANHLVEPEREMPPDVLEDNERGS